MADIAVIGAGISGLVAARRLHEAGHVVSVFDKSRGVGGRMATRRAGDWRFDHGAQFFTARGAAFRDFVAAGVREGWAAPWFEDRFVGVPTMNAPAKALAEGLNVTLGTEIAWLSRASGRWRLSTADAQLTGAFDAVLVAAPAPQAARMISTADIDPAPVVGDVTYAPCWTLMLGFGDAPALPRDHMRRDDGPVAWMARNASKPGRPVGEAVVVHASPDWSREHLEAPGATVENDMLAAFRDMSGVTEAPVFRAVHRWRYAMVESAMPSSCWWDADEGLGACGDGFGGPRVEAAFDSGVALARHVAGALSPR